MWSHTEAGSDQLVREEVAVKTIDSKASESDRIKFWQEAAIMAQFKHNNILRMKGILIDQKVSYYRLATYKPLTHCVTSDLSSMFFEDAMIK